jgi:hypothetical protein
LVLANASPVQTRRKHNLKVVCPSKLARTWKFF